MAAIRTRPILNFSRLKLAWSDISVGTRVKLAQRSICLKHGCNSEISRQIGLIFTLFGALFNESNVDKDGICPFASVYVATGAERSHPCYGHAV